jgi:hypothetical protein
MTLTRPLAISISTTEVAAPEAISLPPIGSKGTKL